MSRPTKCRHVCCMPENRRFDPQDPGPDRVPVVLTVDEYEAVRLIDQNGLSQEECGAYMNIARTTVQQIYTVARRKLAEMLVEGRSLVIQGGRYQLCEREEGCGSCCRRRCVFDTANKCEEETK